MTVAILVNNLIVTFLIHPAKLLAIYAEIADEESKDPTYASVGVATGKYTYNITTNTSYDTVMLHNMNPNTCYGIASNMIFVIITVVAIME